MESEVRILLINLLIIMALEFTAALALGLFIGAGAVDTKDHYIQGQKSCAVCEVKYGK